MLESCWEMEPTEDTEDELPAVKLTAEFGGLAFQLVNAFSTPLLFVLAPEQPFLKKAARPVLEHSKLNNARGQKSKVKS